MQTLKQILLRIHGKHKPMTYFILGINMYKVYAIEVVAYYLMMATPKIGIIIGVEFTNWFLLTV